MYFVPSSLVVLASIAGLYVVSYSFFNVWPIVVQVHRIQSLVSYKVSCPFRIVALVYNLQLESVAVYCIYVMFVGHHFVL